MLLVGQITVIAFIAHLPYICIRHSQTSSDTSGPSW
jgi:hypothetical protein